jgi:hypothetical protein
MTLQYKPLEDPAPWGENQTTPTPVHAQPSRAPSRAVSPTPSLHEVNIPSYNIGGTEYTNIDQGINTEGEKIGIPPQYIKFIRSTVIGISALQASAFYNALGNKLYKHKQLWSEALDVLQLDIESYRLTIAKQMKTIDTLIAANNKLEKELGQLHLDHDQLNANTRTIYRQNQDINARLALLEAQTQLAPAPAATAPPQFFYTPPGPQFAPPAGPPPPPQGPSGPTFVLQPPPPAPAAPVNALSQVRYKVPDPPKFKGTKGSDVTLEQWLQKFGIWLRHCQHTDKQAIIAALTYLEGGAQQFMTDYADRAAKGLPLGTWMAFEAKLRSRYQLILPQHVAQQKLAKICSKKHGSLSTFAEKFQQYAALTGFSDADLIQRINQQQSKNVILHMSLQKTMMPTSIPTTWAEYLTNVLCIDMELRNSMHKEKHTTTTTAPKPDDAMDVDAMRERKDPEPMNNKQKEWLGKRLCFRCGKHPYRVGQRCRLPKYSGYYKIPKRSKKARVVDEPTVSPVVEAGPATPAYNKGTHRKPLWQSRALPTSGIF